MSGDDQFYWDINSYFRIEVNVRRELLGSQDQTAVLAPNALGLPEDPDSIWRAVGRIRSSRTMSGCNRLVQLLNFIVGATLKGEAIYLKRDDHRRSCLRLEVRTTILRSTPSYAARRGAFARS